MQKPHWSFWLLGLAALVWNGLGCANFVAQMSSEMVAGMPDQYKALIEERPIWATAGFGVAVFAGFVGCVFLMLRKRGAISLFALSLLGVILALLHAIIFVSSHTNMGPVLISTGMSLAVAAYLLWYARRAHRNGWLS